jgi:hypothetical protein
MAAPKKSTPKRFPGYQGGTPIVNKQTGFTTGYGNRTTPRKPSTSVRTYRPRTSKPETSIQRAIGTGVMPNNPLKKFLKG